MATWNSVLFPFEDDYSEESGPDSIALCDIGMSTCDAADVKNDPFFHLSMEELEQRQRNHEHDRRQHWQGLSGEGGTRRVASGAHGFRSCR